MHVSAIAEPPKRPVLEDGRVVAWGCSKHGGAAWWHWPLQCNIMQRGAPEPRMRIPYRTERVT